MGGNEIIDEINDMRGRMKEKDTKKTIKIETLRKGEEEKDRIVTIVSNARNQMRIIKGENDLIIKKTRGRNEEKNERIKKIEKDKREFIKIIVNLEEQTKNIISTTRATYEEVVKEIQENRRKKQKDEN